MKILFPFVGDTVGGSHHSSIILMKNLSKFGIESIALIHKDGNLKDFLIDNKINFIFKPFPFWKEKKSPLLNLVQVLKITIFIIFKLKELNVDVVHINDGRMRNTWSLAARILSKRIIFHQRTIFDSSKLSYLLLFTPEKIIAISDFVKKSLPNRFNRKTKVIYNPFISKNSSSKRDSKITICKKLCLNDKKYILSVIGTVTNQKRPIIAIQALDILQKKGINSILLFIGNISPENKKLLMDEAKRYKLEKSIKIIGYKKNIELYLKGSDFIIAPAINEGFGRVLVEAMLAKTIVIASNHGGHKEIIKNKINGILIKPNSSTSMAEAIKFLINDKKICRKIVRNAHNYALKNFNVQNHLNSVIKIYLKLKNF